MVLLILVTISDDKHKDHEPFAGADELSGSEYSNQMALYEVIPSVTGVNVKRFYLLHYLITLRTLSLSPLK